MIGLHTTFSTVQFAAEAKHAGGIAVLGIDGKTLIIQIVTFALVFIILKKYAFGPIIKSLETRYEKIESSLTHAEKLEQTNKQAEARAQKLLRDARKEAEDVINKGHEEAGSLVKQAEDQAGEKAAKIIKDGEARIAGEIVKAREALKKETLGLVAQATSVLLEKEIDVKQSEKLVHKALLENAGDK